MCIKYTLMDYQQLRQILFLDIETVAAKPDFEQLDERFQYLWEKKSRYYKSEQTPAEQYKDRAAISAEFGRILVIGIGYFHLGEDGISFKTKALVNEDEGQLLKEFKEMVDQHFSKDWRFCAHNGKEFDFPYLCRRLLIHGLGLPKPLQIMGKKPWETPQLIDTMELWKFGDIKAYTSLELMAASLGVPTSKDDIDGSQVGQVYFETGDVNRIALYCQKDVSVMAQVLMKLLGLGSLADSQITMNN